MFLEGERHGASKRAGGAGEAAVREREDEAVRLLGDQYAERVGPMRVHPDGNQCTMPAHGPEGDQHQVAPGLQVEFDLPAGHLVHAARDGRGDGGALNGGLFTLRARCARPGDAREHTLQEASSWDPCHEVDPLSVKESGADPMVR